MRNFINIINESSSYQRVIPRDLFNEANLLKCYGQIYLNLEKMNVDAQLKHSGDAFQIVQDGGDGSLSIANIAFMVRGEQLNIQRPMNSRRSFHLIIVTDDWEEMEMFEENGAFTPDMIALLEGENQIDK